VRQFLRCLDDTGEKYQKTNEAYVDGYSFGDRLLEGVMFRITLVGNKFKAEVPPEFATYMEDLNEKKWLKAAEECCEEIDVFHASMDSHSPNNDVVCYDDEKALDEQTFGCKIKPNIIA
jgi:hypothetical protein